MPSDALGWFVVSWGVLAAVVIVGLAFVVWLLSGEAPMVDAGTAIGIAGVGIALLGLVRAGSMYVFRAEVRERVTAALEETARVKAASEKQTALVKAQIDAHERECAERNRNVEAHNAARDAHDAAVAADVSEIRRDIKQLLGRHGFSGV
jgi:hypothetical protein